MLPYLSRGGQSERTALQRVNRHDLISRSYLVTGASSGIGLSIVQQLARHGHRIIATGLRPASELPADFPDIAYHAIDAADEAALAAFATAECRSLDRAILCAGAGFYRGIEEETSDDVRRIVDVNFTAQVRLVHNLYGNLERRRGRLALIGSVARKGAASMPVYAATKAALDGFGRSLSVEWQGRVVVKVLHPGPTATGMAERAGRQADWLSRLMLPAESMARMIVVALERNGGFRQTLSYGRHCASISSRLPF